MWTFFFYRVVSVSRFPGFASGQRHAAPGSGLSEDATHQPHVVHRCQVSTRSDTQIDHLDWGWGTKSLYSELRFLLQEKKTQSQQDFLIKLSWTNSSVKAADVWLLIRLCALNSSGITCLQWTWRRRQRSSSLSWWVNTINRKYLAAAGLWVCWAHFSHVLL